MAGGSAALSREPSSRLEHYSHAVWPAIPSDPQRITSSSKITALSQQDLCFEDLGRLLLHFERQNSDEIRQENFKQNIELITGFQGNQYPEK